MIDLVISNVKYAKHNTDKKFAGVDLIKHSIFQKIFETNSSFMRNSALRKKFNFCFFKGFLLVLTKFAFWQEDWTLGYYSMNFPDIS